MPHQNLIRGIAEKSPEIALKYFSILDKQIASLIAVSACDAESGTFILALTYPEAAIYE
jgi:hypothetical protein